MKFKKTNKENRGSYKLFDDDGRFITEYKPGKDGVTEVDILNLHKIDDHEVYINNKDRRLPEWYKPTFDVWKENFIKSFKEEYGREPYRNEIPKAHRQYISIESQITANGDELGDSSWLEAELAVSDEEDISDTIIRLREIVAAMPEQWQNVYQLVFIEGLSKAKVGKMIGITDVRVGQLARKIEAKIANDEVLKKIYR